MSNPLYWEDQVSGSHGGQTEMIVDRHAPSFAVTYGTGKYDHVTPNHANLLGSPNTYAPCSQCGRPSSLTFGVCAACQRTMHDEEQRRIRHDQPMGDHKRTPITLDRTR